MSGNYRVRRSTQRGERSSRQDGERRIGYIGRGRLLDWERLRENPTELLMWMNSNGPELTEFLNSDSIRFDYLSLLMSSLEAVLKVKCHENSFSKLLEVLVSTKFYTTHILSYLEENNNLASKKIAETICQLIKETAILIPEKVSGCRKTLVLLAENYTRLRCDVQLIKEAISAFNSSGKVEEKKKKHRLRKWKLTDEPPEDIRDLSIFPTSTDLDTSIEPFLRANQVKGAYRDTGHYFDVLFRLLREDFIQPLREGISEFRSRKGSTSTNSDMIFYTNVRIVGINIFSGIEHILLLDLDKLKDIRWDTERRLIFGSLVCLSHDNFQTIIYATVTQLDRNELKKGLLRVQFQNCLEDVYRFSSEDRLTMTENPSFFEAYRHVLEGLQEMVEMPLPLTDYLVRCQTEVSKPSYLTGNTQYDISCLFNEGHAYNYHTFPVLDIGRWPHITRLCLNTHQFQAVSSALTKELALIQGPPGTGKTYVGLKIMRVLLENTNRRFQDSYLRIKMDDPILVVCYTNHALDQFLEGILPFCKDGIVRIGGRSQSEALNKYNLKELREREFASKTLSVRNNIRDIHREMDELGARILELNYKMQVAHMEIQDVGLMKRHIDTRHYQALLSETGASKGVMRLWLNSTTVSFDDHLSSVVEAHLVSLVHTVQGYSDDKAVLSRVPVSVMTRVLVYKGWERKCRQKYKLPENSDILSDNVLIFVITPNAYGHIKRYYPSIRAWVLGRTLDEMLNTIEAIKNEETSSRGQIYDNPDEYKRIREQRVFDDDSDIEDGFADSDREVSRRPKTVPSTAFQRAKLLGVDLTADDDDSTEENEWQTVRKRLTLAKVIKKLNSTEPMTEVRQREVTDVWQLNLNERYQLYKVWQFRYLDELNLTLKSLVNQYDCVLARKTEVRSLETVNILKKAKIIGLTTTGAAKHRKILQKVGPRIVVVEEAAEVLEAHIITALSECCQHLILIGDHQQLRPKTEVHELAKYFGMEISLFERLIKNGLRRVQLTEQHRMRPEISVFMKHIYPKLTDSDSVMDRADIKGVAHNVFFISHHQPEDIVKNSRSKLNDYEAKYLIQLSKYLLYQGYSDNEITILATYGGQVALIKEYMQENDNKEIKNIRVSTVDNFQGEQNKIILLSLVRSNSQEKVGFLSTNNRICVALSRAQEGMYVIGDIDLLSRHSSLWQSIKVTATAKGCLGDTLQVRCQNHKRVTNLRNLSDFDKLVTGGCGEKCKQRMKCGHTCTYMCHAVDHKYVKCKFPCPQILTCGHKCSSTCHTADHRKVKCTTPCTIKLTCGHSCQSTCHTADHKRIKCTQPCEKTCRAGHKCQTKCGELCPPCLEEVTEVLSCGHTGSRKCYDLYTKTHCQRCHVADLTTSMSRLGLSKTYTQQNSLVRPRTAQNSRFE